MNTSSYSQKYSHPCSITFGSPHKVNARAPVASRAEGRRRASSVDDGTPDDAIASNPRVRRMVRGPRHDDDDDDGDPRVVVRAGRRRVGSARRHALRARGSSGAGQRRGVRSTRARRLLRVPERNPQGCVSQTQRHPNSPGEGGLHQGADRPARDGGGEAGGLRRRRRGRRAAHRAGLHAVPRRPPRGRPACLPRVIARRRRRRRRHSCAPRRRFEDPSRADHDPVPLPRHTSAANAVRRHRRRHRRRAGEGGRHARVARIEHGRILRGDLRPAPSDRFTNR